MRAEFSRTENYIQIIGGSYSARKHCTVLLEIALLRAGFDVLRADVPEYDWPASVQVAPEPKWGDLPSVQSGQHTRMGLIVRLTRRALREARRASDQRGKRGLPSWFEADRCDPVVGGVGCAQ